MNNGKKHSIWSGKALLLLVFSTTAKAGWISENNSGNWVKVVELYHDHNPPIYTFKVTRLGDVSDPEGYWSYGTCSEFKIDQTLGGISTVQDVVWQGILSNIQLSMSGVLALDLYTTSGSPLNCYISKIKFRSLDN